MTSISTGQRISVAGRSTRTADLHVPANPFQPLFGDVLLSFCCWESVGYRWQVPRVRAGALSRACSPSTVSATVSTSYWCNYTTTVPGYAEAGAVGQPRRRGFRRPTG